MSEYVRCGDDAPCSVASDLRSQVRELEAAEWRWRSALWYRHGCPFPALYGDDGEMQCAACSIDFKRASVEDIEARWRTIGALLTTPTKEVMPHYPDGPPGPHSTPAPVVTSAAGAAPFMLPEPEPATPIPPDPRDAVVEAADDYERLWMKVHETDGATRDDRVRIGHVRGHLFAAIRDLRAAEGRG